MIVTISKIQRVCWLDDFVAIQRLVASLLPGHEARCYALSTNVCNVQLYDVRNNRHVGWIHASS